MNEYQEKGFYERVKKAWEHAGYPNQESFANASGINKSTISRWQDRDGLPQVSTLIAICNTCGCDLEYLMGKSTTFKKENNDIATDTGLNEKAIKKLKANKKEADKVSANNYFWNGFSLTESLIIKEADDPRFNSSKMLPDFLSFLITDKSDLIPGKTTLEVITERIARENADIAQLYTDPEREYLIKAYHLAESDVSRTAPNYTGALKGRFEERIKEVMLENEEEIQSRLNPADGFIEYLYIPEQARKFYLVHSVLDPDRNGLIDNLNQVDLMNLIRRYREITIKFKKEMLRENARSK